MALVAIVDAGERIDMFEAIVNLIDLAVEIKSLQNVRASISHSMSLSESCFDDDHDDLRMLLSCWRSENEGESPRNPFLRKTTVPSNPRGPIFTATATTTKKKLNHKK